MPATEEPRRGIQILIVPQPHGATRSLMLPGWGFQLALGGLAAMMVMMIGGAVLTARMGLELGRLRGVEALNDSLRSENRRIGELEQELTELDGLRRRMLQLAGADVRAEVEARMAEHGRPAAIQVATAPESPPRIGLGSLPSIWPAEGVASKEFEADPGSDRLHHGIDIAAPHGNPVRAAGAGTVVFAGEDSVFGLLVIIDHGKVDRGAEVKTLYGHNSSLGVAAGDRVLAGQEIARVGTTGVSSAPHLHFEVQRAGVPIDPRNYLGK